MSLPLNKDPFIILHSGLVWDYLITINNRVRADNSSPESLCAGRERTSAQEAWAQAWLQESPELSLLRSSSGHFQFCLCSNLTVSLMPSVQLSPTSGNTCSDHGRHSGQECQRHRTSAVIRTRGSFHSPPYSSQTIFSFHVSVSTWTARLLYLGSLVVGWFL